MCVRIDFVSRILLLIMLGAINGLAVDETFLGLWTGTMEAGTNPVHICVGLGRLFPRPPFSDPLADLIGGTLQTDDDAGTEMIEKVRITGDEVGFETRSTTGQRLQFRLHRANEHLSGEVDDGVHAMKVNLRRDGQTYECHPKPNHDSPIPLYRTEPEYTDEAREGNIQGTVILEVQVEPNGKVSSDRIRIIQSLGYGLDERAIACVKKWNFLASLRRWQANDEDCND